MSTSPTVSPPFASPSSRVRSLAFATSAFAIGLAFGVSGFWMLKRRVPSDPGTISVPPELVLPSWSWRVSDIPPALAADQAGAAIAAWSALRGVDGRPADFAVRADALHALLVRLSPEDLPRLLAALAPDRSTAGLRLLDIGFDAWVDVDPAAATRWAASAKLDSTEFAVRGVRAWSSQDPEGAAVWACALEDSDLATRLAGWALASLAKKDSARALALANSRDDAFRAAVFSSIIGPLSKADPAAAVQAYGPLIWKDGEGFYTLQEALQSWAQRDPASAITWLCSRPHGSLFMLSLARSSGNQASIASAVATAPGIPERHDVLVNLIAAWKDDKPAEALEWLRGLGDPDRSAQLLLDAMNRSSPASPELALTLSLGLPEGDIRTERLGRALAEWAERDTTAALAWIDNHPEPGVAAAAAEVHATLLATIAREEPATALAEWRALSDPRSRAASLLPIARAWGESDPAAAISWYYTQKAAEGAAIATNEVFSLGKPIYAWAKKDPEAALRWAEAFSKTSMAAANTPDWARLMPLYALAGDQNESAPRAATADLYAKIQDSALRSEMLASFARNWLTTDPVSAKAWIEKSSALTPAQTAALLGPAK